MINQIIEAISVALDSEFGDGYKIYREEVEQDLEAPCFMVQCIDDSNKVLRGQRYFRSSQFSVRYFPKSDDDGSRECYSAMERMNTCLEYIAVDGRLMRGTQRNGRVADGVLNFFVNYNCCVYKRVEEPPKMGEMASSATIQ